MEQSMENENHHSVKKENLPGPTTIEEELQRLWKDILDLPSVTPDDDFFLFGGNSLTAIELLIRIQREYKVNFPPDTIYRYPTIRQQAVLIAGKVAKTPQYHTLIVPIREGGIKPPLFCIHPLGGWMDHYTRVSPYIDRNRPIFGIRARGLEPTEVMPLTVEETVREQVDAIKSVQKDGPYHIMGFSNGGTIAYELACQIAEKGDRVAFLGLIDVSAPAPEVRYLKTLTKTFFPGRILGKIPAFIESHLKANPDSRIFFIVSKSIRFVFHKTLFRSGSKSLPASVSDDFFDATFDQTILARYPKESHNHMKAQMKASRIYLPHQLPGDLILFSTMPDPILFPGDITRGWSSYVTGKTTVIDVTGDHSNLFDEPHLGYLGLRVDKSLASVDERG